MRAWQPLSLASAVNAYSASFAPVEVISCTATPRPLSSSAGATQKWALHAQLQRGSQKCRKYLGVVGDPDPTSAEAVSAVVGWVVKVRDEITESQNQHTPSKSSGSHQRGSGSEISPEPEGGKQTKRARTSTLTATGTAHASASKRAAASAARSVGTGAAASAAHARAGKKAVGKPGSARKSAGLANRAEQQAGARAAQDADQRAVWARRRAYMRIPR